MSRQVLEFEQAELTRDQRDVYYGQSKNFPLWVRNIGASPLVVSAVGVRLQPETQWTGDDSDLTFRDEGLGMELQPQEREHVTVRVSPGLFCLPSSNCLTAIAEYRVLAKGNPGDRMQAAREAFSWVNLLEPSPVRGAEVFVSFVDPEDYSLAQLASRYLRRSGMKAYIAREDTQPGCDMWTGKIEPAIARAVGTLVIWTLNTVARPASVRREIRLAQQLETPVGLFRGGEAEPPGEYPRALREYVQFGLSSPHVPFAKGIAAGARLWREKGWFF